MNRRFLNRRSFSRIISMLLCISLFACICSSSVLASAEDGDSAERDFIIIAEHNAESGQTTYEIIDLRPLRQNGANAGQEVIYPGYSPAQQDSGAGE